MTLRFGGWIIESGLEIQNEVSEQDSQSCVWMIKLNIFQGKNTDLCIFKIFPIL